jgi:hypothetical protein
MGHIDDVLMQKVNNAITISFGLMEQPEAPAAVAAVTTENVTTATA